MNDASFDLEHEIQIKVSTKYDMPHSNNTK